MWDVNRLSYSNDVNFKPGALAEVIRLKLGAVISYLTVLYRLSSINHRDLLSYPNCHKAEAAQTERR